MDHRYNKFLVLVEEGSYSKAAKRLRISQPAMTIAIASLEMGLNQKLFVQKKPSVVLSDAGKVVHAAAIKIKKSIDEMNKNLADLSSDNKVQIGIIDSIAYLIYSNTQNNIILNDIDAMVDNSRKIITDVIDSQVDFGIITGQSGAMTTGLKIEKLNNEKFVFATKPSLAKDEPVKIINDWLSFNRASTSYHHFTKQFTNLGMQVKPIFYSTSLELLKEMAIQGKGTALLPRHFVEKELANGSLKALNTPQLYRPIWTITKKDKNDVVCSNLSNHINKMLASV